MSGARIRLDYEDAGKSLPWLKTLAFFSILTGSIAAVILVVLSIEEKVWSYIWFAAAALGSGVYWYILFMAAADALSYLDLMSRTMLELLEKQEGREHG